MQVVGAINAIIASRSNNVLFTEAAFVLFVADIECGTICVATTWFAVGEAMEAVDATVTGATFDMRTTTEAKMRLEMNILS